MANLQHLKILLSGTLQFAAWRKANGNLRPDLAAAILQGVNLYYADLGEADLNGANLGGANLGGANLGGASLNGANLSGANLGGADLRGADLSEADLSWADLNWADLSGANLGRADLSGSNLNWADLRGAYLGGTDLSKADLREASLSGAAYLKGVDLHGANLSGANLSRVIMNGVDLEEADLRGANLGGADLRRANLNRAKLSGANLERANLKGADLSGADLRQVRLAGCCLEEAILQGCRVYGTAAWDVKINERTDQRNLLITDVGEAAVSVDNLKIARFLHLLLDNTELKDAIDALTLKAVLILGHFSPERQSVLAALQGELRRRDHLPIVFNFAGSETQTTIETVRALAGLSRFVIADLADGRSIPAQLHTTVSELDNRAFVLIAEKSSRIHGQVENFLNRVNVVQAIFEYSSPEHLMASLVERVVASAQAWSEQLCNRHTRPITTPLLSDIASSGN
ncbi:pentapeptide repeat-containing protein [Gloeobacter kilaueensis]|uniref:Pentapeptide repeat-containing protein n=1 Tax=Gloeobacter kilaueensis (strain ATCC BAA-2537 / CCAP 1431/1 / ULC 316 / JS1) TaxID=1183438 RepID=U5QH89_GLOK1|nr:pentapeptide repeat-containing protein [Gloeobacter kilaueensis]AGY58263.1 pentapeptide repeat-containing protein [Gloeobacter kilaueensis JS1]